MTLASKTIQKGTIRKQWKEKMEGNRSRSPKITPALLPTDFPESTCLEKTTSFWTILALWIILHSKENKQGRLRKFLLNFKLVSWTSLLSRFLCIYYHSKKCLYYKQIWHYTDWWFSDYFVWTLPHVNLFYI